MQSMFIVQLCSLCSHRSASVKVDVFRGAASVGQLLTDRQADMRLLNVLFALALLLATAAQGKAQETSESKSSLR